VEAFNREILEERRQLLTLNILVPDVIYYTL